MIFKGINHVAIIVSNLDISREFYVGKLGFRLMDEIHRPERSSSILYLDTSGVMLELFSFPNPPPRLSYPEACGLRHIAFNTDKFDEVLDDIRRQGIEVEEVRKDERTGKRMTFIKDPDGLPLEVCEQ